MIIASQIFYVFFNLLARLQKSKGKTLFLFTIGNIFSILTYIFLGQMAGGFLVIAATLRTINFSLYDYYKLKPNLLVLLTFEITYILIVICTWQSSVDIVILLSVEILTYALWQNNMYILRIGMIITAIVAIIYNILVNAYIAIIGEFVCLIAVIISIIYYDVYKRSTPIIKRLLYYVKPKRKRKRLKARLRKRK